MGLHGFCRREPRLRNKAFINRKELDRHYPSSGRLTGGTLCKYLIYLSFLKIPASPRPLEITVFFRVFPGFSAFRQPSCYGVAFSQRAPEVRRHGPASPISGRRNSNPPPIRDQQRKHERVCQNLHLSDLSRQRSHPIAPGAPHASTEEPRITPAQPRKVPWSQE